MVAGGGKEQRAAGRGEAAGKISQFRFAMVDERRVDDGSQIRVVLAQQKADPVEIRRGDDGANGDGSRDR